MCRDCDCRVICDVGVVVVVCFLKIFFVVKQKEAHTRTPPPTLLGGVVSEVLPVSLTMSLSRSQRGHGSGGFELNGCWLKSGKRTDPERVNRSEPELTLPFFLDLDLGCRR